MMAHISFHRGMEASRPLTCCTSYVAAQDGPPIASQTLVGKLGSAFWDAFSGSGNSASGRAQWDADKVRRVLEGKAVVRVVDIEPVSAPVSPVIPSASFEKAGPSRAPSSPRLASTLSEKPGKCTTCLVDMLGSLRI